jgi:5-formyltetrahydrofolate cyclo-ligase
MTPCVSDKKELRLLLKSRRAAISAERRGYAAEWLLSALLPKLARYKNILSFHSLPEEIDSSLLNAKLAQGKRLLLPRVAGEGLLIYRVNDLQNELQLSPLGIWEPSPELCTSVDLEVIDCILVPGLGFNKLNQRIGYGKGHYDRLLYKAKELSISPKIIGIGFKEQLVEELPCEPHDMPLDELILF